MKINVKYFLIVVAAIALSNTTVQAQEKISFVDSLKREVQNSANVQTQIELQMQLCWLLRNQNPEEALLYGNQALSLIESNHRHENYPQVLNYLGVVHRNKGDYSYALILYKQALEWANKTNNQVQLGYAHNNIGGIYTLKNSYPEAIDQIEKALSIFEKLGKTDGIGFASINLGNLYRHLKSYTASMRYFDRAEEIKIQLNDTIGLLVVKQLKADIFKEQGKISEAKSLFLELRKTYQHNNDIKGQAIVLNELGLLELKNSAYSQAFKLLLEAETINIKIENKQGLAYNSINLGLAYHGLNQNDQAIQKLNKGLLLGNQLGDKQIGLMAYQAYSQVYADLKDWKLAYQAKENYLKVYKEIYNYEQSEQINAIRDKYLFEKQLSEHQLLEERNLNLEKENKFTEGKFTFLKIGAFVLLVFFLSISLLLFFYFRKIQEGKASSLLLNKQNAELIEANHTKEKFLSIIGHDLKNPFNSVLGLSNLIIDQWGTIDDEEKFQITNEINSSSENIYELLDNLLIWSRTQTRSTTMRVEKFDLNENIHQIFEIFKNQANFKKINVRMDFKGEKLVLADPNMIATVIRNLLSNSLKFTQEGGQILIRTEQKADMVEFSISDNGKGILPEDLKRIFEDKGNQASKGTANETGTGLGLLLAKEFIQQNGGLIWVESKPGKGSLFTFTLPTA
ncbi:MAG TPA: hypothetical protein DCG69_06270 [Bacteroidales bacterium]|nr:hypothetical protein [Bacteroidales bacterium]